MSLKNSLLRLTDKALSAFDPSGETPCAVAPNDHQFYWAMRNFPIQYANQNMAVIGGIGSGKTTLIQLFLQSIAHRLKPGRERPEQLIIYDAKTEVIPLLEAAGLSPNDPNFWILHPLDRRGASWAMGEAVQHPAYARALSKVVSPRDENSNAPFFADAAGTLVKEVMAGLSAVVGGEWSFRDLLCALDSPEHILAVAAHNARSHRIVQNILNDEKHGLGVISTLMTKLQEFEEVAALWHTSSALRPVFSIDKFFEQSGVLVLGFDSELKDALWPANRMILNAITQKVLNQGDSARQPRFWFILDEFPAMRDLDFVVDLMNRGRSKGASVLLGAQTISGLRAIYKKERTDEILGDCTFKTFLQTADHETAEWMSSTVGTVRYWEEDYSQSSSKGETSNSTSCKVAERRALIDSVFKYMPRADSGGEFHAVHVTPKGPIYTRSWADDVFAMRWKTPDQSEYNSAIQRRSEVEDQFLVPWSPEEEEKFCRSRKDDNSALPPPPADPFAPKTFKVAEIKQQEPAARPAPEKAKTPLKTEQKPWKRPQRLSAFTSVILDDMCETAEKDPRDRATRLPQVKATKPKRLPGLDLFDGGAQ